MKLIELQAPSREKPRIDIEVYGRKAILTIDYWKTVWQISKRGHTEIIKFCWNYMARRNLRGNIVVHEDIVRFPIRRSDLDQILPKLMQVVEKHLEPWRPRGGGAEDAR